MNSHQKETVYDRLIFFPKLVRQWKLKEKAKFGLEDLQLIFIYSNSKFEITSKCGLWMLHHKLFEQMQSSDKHKSMAKFFCVPKVFCTNLTFLADTFE